MSEVLALLAILLVLALGVLALRVARRPKACVRRAALGRLAKRLGWRFLGEEKHEGFDSLYPQFDQFDRGHTHHAHNRLVGSLRGFGAELAVEAGDYCYEIPTGLGKNSADRTCRFSYLLVALPFGPLLPSLRVRPESFHDKLSATGGFEDVELESAEFCGLHHVSSDNRRFTHTLMDSRMIEFLLAAPPPLFELGGGALLIVSAPDADDSRWRPEDFAKALAWAGDFLARWPSHLVTDLRARC